MNYEMTDERQAYFEARGYTVLMACPGSGKTTSIVNKLKIIIQECEQSHGKGIGILCLSFTNAACDEIRNCFRSFHGETLHYPHIVSTIDSFLTQYIVLPYWYLCTYCHSRPSIINDERVMHRFFFINNGDKEYLVKALKDYHQLPYNYAPEKIRKEGNGYKIDNMFIDKNRHKELLPYCTALFKYKLDRGIIDSNDALWLACHILKKNPSIANAIAHRFPYIIIDEAQDTSELQFYIFKTLRAAGAENIGFIGDLNQSIYEWRNAKPDILSEYANSGNWNLLHLTENWRSVQRIIDFYSRLKPASYPTIISNVMKDKQIKVLIYRYDNGLEQDILHRFQAVCDNNNLKDRLILARGTADLRRLAAIKKPVFPWKSEIPYRIIRAQLHYTDNEITQALFQMRWAIADLIYSDKVVKKVDFIRSHEKDYKFNAIILQLLASFPPLTSSFNYWDTQVKLLLQQQLGLNQQPNFIFKQKLQGFQMQILKQESIDAYYGKNHNKEVQAQTIHSVKGASVDAVLLFLNEKSSAQGISIKDIPESINAIVEMNEKQRLIYVACSRAKQCLAIAVPSTITEKTLIKRFCGLDIQIISTSVQNDLFT